jgi:tripartite-type tricarboxylate transporter receptor subunit TctC
MRRSTGIAAAVLAAAVLPAAVGAGTVGALAQGYPERVVEMVNPYPPGGATDIMGRALAESLSAPLGQRVIVLNKPGANGAIGTAAVARAAPDGYTLLFTAAVSMVVNPLTQTQAGYTLGSFDHICQAFKNEMVIVVHPESPLRSVADLIRVGKEKPGALNYAILGIGSIPHLVAVELSQVAGVTFNPIPFKGDADVMQQIHGRHVDFGVVVLASAANSGVRILGLFSKVRNPAIPEVATMREQGFDVAPASIGGLSAPAGLPPGVKRRLDEACRSAALSDGYAKALRNVFQPNDYYAGGEDYTKSLQQDLVDKRRLLTQLGMIK